jgi:hypothetical protein
MIIYKIWYIDMNLIKIYKLYDTIIFNKSDDSDFFYANGSMFSISIINFSTLIKAMLYKRFLSPKVLEGILSEYYDNTEDCT